MEINPIILRMIEELTQLLEETIEDDQKETLLKMSQLIRSELVQCWLKRLDPDREPKSSNLGE